MEIRERTVCEKSHKYVTNIGPRACASPRMRRRSLLFFSMIALLLSSKGTGARAQGTKADYERAATFGARTSNKVFRARVRPVWNANGTGFWYRVDTGPSEHEFIRVDAEKGTREAAFDHARLAKSLLDVGVAGARPLALPIEEMEFAADGTTVDLRLGETWWRCDLNTYTIEKVEHADKPLAGSRSTTARASRRTGEETEITFRNGTRGTIELFWLDPEGERQSYGKLAAGEERRQHTFGGHVWLAIDDEGRELLRMEAEEQPTRVVIDGNRRPARAGGQSQGPIGRPAPSANSPDGKWAALIRDNNLILRDRSSGEECPLSNDGTADDPYQRAVHWSPDSKRIVCLQVRKPQEHKVKIIESSPRDQVQPKIHEYDYLKPGDVIAHPRPRSFDVEKRAAIPIDEALFSNPWSIGDLRWAADSSRFTFLYNQRGHQVLRVVAVDAKTGDATALVDEQSRTFLDYSDKSFTFWLEDTNELLWMSERDGYNHLWLYDTNDGRVKNQVTKGPWVVRRIERVDPEKRLVWFFAGGVRPEQDPYYLHLCRVGFDGSDFQVLTEGNGTHTVEFSPDRRYFLDTWSRVDQPPTIELRRSDDGRLLCTLETADATRLASTGWRAPEPFVAKGRDGSTDIFGIIIRPSNFDPARKYPVIEQIYAGPQSAFVPKGWGIVSNMHTLAELGFVVVQIDGMGTNWRSKAFHDVCWKNLADAGFPDRIAWLRAAAETRPWMDLSRVGIYGGSAGGQNAMRGLLDHGDFYKAGVADCGCHDNRMDKIWWNELWMGWPIGPEYEASSNVSDAHKLQGQLLLIVGELDRNVDPASTMQVVNALIKADKDFDLLVVPGAGHGAGGSRYGRRRQMDFFVRHLLGVEPRSAP